MEEGIAIIVKRKLWNLWKIGFLEIGNCVNGIVKMGNCDSGIVETWNCENLEL